MFRFTMYRPLLSIVILAAVALGGCTEGGGSEDEQPPAGGDGDASTGRQVSFADIELSKLFHVQLPQHVMLTGFTPQNQDGGAKSRLAPAALSVQACEARGDLAVPIGWLTGPGAMYCTLETDPKFKLGVKYNFPHPKGEDGKPLPNKTSTQVWVDDSAQKSTGIVTAHICMDKKPFAMARFKMKGKGRFLGQVLTKFHGKFPYDDETDFKIRALSRVDVKYSSEDRTKLTLWRSVEGNKGDQLHKQGSHTLYFDVAETGVSKFTGISEMFYPDLGKSHVGYVGRFSAELGSSISYDWRQPPGAERGSAKTLYDTYTGEGVPVARPRPEFEEGGSHYLTASDLPAGRAFDDAPIDMPADAWDCETTVDVPFEPLLPANKACALEYNYPQVCNGTLTRDNEIEIAIDESKLVAPSVYDALIGVDSSLELGR